MKVRALVVAGAHHGVQAPLERYLAEQNLANGQVDVIRLEGAAVALSDPDHPAHEATMRQLTESVRLHNPDWIGLAGPTDWGGLLQQGRLPSPVELQRKLEGAALNIERRMERFHDLVTTKLFEYEELLVSLVTRVKALALSCIDPRFFSVLLQTVKEVLGAAHLSTVVGATGAITNDATRVAMVEQVEMLRPCGLREVHLFPHWGCLYYGGHGENEEEKREHFNTLIAEIRRAIEIMSSWFDGITVGCPGILKQTGLVRLGPADV